MAEEFDDIGEDGLLELMLDLSEEVSNILATLMHHLKRRLKKLERCDVNHRVEDSPLEDVAVSEDVPPVDDVAVTTPPPSRRMGRKRIPDDIREGIIRSQYEVPKPRLSVLAARYGISTGSVHNIIKDWRRGKGGCASVGPLPGQADLPFDEFDPVEVET